MSFVKKLKRRVSTPNLNLDGESERYVPATRNLTRRHTEAVITLPRSRPEICQVMPKCYVKGLEREASENLLEHQPIGTYLLRDRQSSNAPGSYTLTMRDKNNQCRHYKIDTNPENHLLSIYGYDDCFFSSLQKLIDNFVEKQTDVRMMPYSGESANDGLYVSMDEDLNSYQNIDSDLSSRSPCTSPTVRTTPSYENIVKNKAMPRRPPPPEPPENMPTKPRSKSFTPDSRLPTHYENLAPKSENVPLPPRHQPAMGGIPNVDRRGSLPLCLAHPPPPLPERPHASVNYQNLPGRGPLTIDSASPNQQTRQPLRRSHTLHPDTKF